MMVPECERTVLVVEDDQEVRDAIAEVLEDSEYKPLPAANGAEALERLRTATPQPCVILLDVMMPTMDGWQFRAAQQSDPAERKLIENLPGCIAWLERLDTADRTDIRAVLQTIVKGQELDLRRFGDPATAVPLKRAAELEEYTYLVAGCVGEFWTNLGFRCLPRFARRSPDEMKKLGIDYGKGLQLINILRDRGVDEKNGRIYFPPSEDISSWMDRAETQTRAGIEYASSLTNWRTRFATALPALIGARTIALLHAAGLEAGTSTVKVPRPEVRRILFNAALATASPSSLRSLFERLLEVRLPA